MALAARTFIWVVTISQIPDKKIPHPMSKFWSIPLPREKSNPRSRQDMYCVPIPTLYFAQIPDLKNTLPDPQRELGSSCNYMMYLSR